MQVYIEALAVLAVTYIVLAGLVSALQEAASQFLSARSRNLRKGISAVLKDDNQGVSMPDRFFNNPVFQSLEGRPTNPTYIEPSQFIHALATAVAPKSLEGDPIQNLPRAANMLKDGPLKDKLQAVLPPVGSSRASVESAVEQWFESIVARVAARYKAGVIYSTYGLAAALTVLLNVNTLTIFTELLEDPILRAASFDAAITFAKEVDPSTQATGAASAPPTAVRRPGELSEADRLAALATVSTCLQSDLRLPIGWNPDSGVFATIFDKVGLTDRRENIANRARELVNKSCAEAIRRIDPEGTTEIGKKLMEAGSRQSADGSSQAGNDAEVLKEALTTRFGPVPGETPIVIILIGWLITIIAIGQGAPFWFNVIRNIVRR